LNRVFLQVYFVSAGTTLCIGKGVIILGIISQYSFWDYSEYDKSNVRTAFDRQKKNSF